MVEIVVALIWEKDKFMICQRPVYKARGLQWNLLMERLDLVKQKSKH